MGCAFLFGHKLDFAGESSKDPAVSSMYLMYGWVGQFIRLQRSWFLLGDAFCLTDSPEGSDFYEVVGAILGEEVCVGCLHGEGILLPVENQNG